MVDLGSNTPTLDDEPHRVRCLEQTGDTLQSEAAPATPCFASALRFWWKLGCISFGGPAGQIAIMHRELVEQRRWISEERFLHALNFCMLLPGPEAQQLATYLGWSQHGIRGGIAAGVLFVLPGLLLMTGLSVLYAMFQSVSLVQGLLFGLKAAVLAVVLEAVVRIAKRALKQRLSWIIAGAAFVAIFALGVPFPVIILMAAILGFVRQRVQPASRTSTAPPAQPSAGAVPPRHGLRSAMRIVLVCGALWFVPIIVLIATLGPDHVLSSQAVFFSKMAVVTFGGAYAVLAYVAQEAVQSFGWLSPDDMLQGLALAETTPGPLILVLSFVGFLAAFRDAAPFDPVFAGVLGAILTSWVTFVPCFLWVLLGAPYIERLRRHQALSAALAMVTAAVVGVILNLASYFAMHALFHQVLQWQAWGLSILYPDVRTMDVPAVMIAALSIVAMFRFRVPMLITLAAAGALGVIYTRVW
jgi:chromate transporter